MNVRKHGRWVGVDWLWLAPFVLLASLWPTWRRQYWGHYVTTSIFTATIYTPTGHPPSDGLMRHEIYHVRQAREVGRWRWAFRYATSARWRIWYEAQAWHLQGKSVDAIIEGMKTMYLVRWPNEHIRAIATAAIEALE